MRVLTLSALLLVAAAGCGGSNKKPTPTGHDLAVAKPDMTATDGCKKLATWPTSKVFAFSDRNQGGYTYVDGVGDDEPNATTSTNYDELLYRYYQASGQPSAIVPHTYEISDSDKFQTCTDCVTAFLNVDASTTSSGDFYFAQAGTITVTRLDNGTPTGTIAASGTDVQLVLWDYANDVPDTTGKCFDVASFDFTATYDNTVTDAGVDM